MKQFFTKLRGQAKCRVDALVIFLRLIRYWRKHYYSGHIRWMLMDKKKRHVSCSECGNIANGIGVKEMWGLIFNVPFCKSHLAPLYFKRNPEKKHLDFPCFVKI